MANNGLQQEAKKNASDISGMMEGIVSYYNAYADTLQVSDYADDAAILKSLEPGMKAYPGVVSDVYLAFGKDYFYDGGGWVPDEGSLRRSE
ncbi:hypothetical protein SAMN04487770_107105 [Butyrivibrio sp. ob235]|uniref:hypothetical protein n=1 Tax=Butyrivibrio sp. ob235 TaxID=1761780 RepID=UPI0008C2786C|nr:hypothetical protein [Butyrivibrio sp. ob235]SEL22579.1 hypothetical protein SAMN04487770_107105 [Butyrivibrio sp. ob235]